MVGNWGKTELEFVVEVSRFVVEVFVCVFFVDIMKGLVLLVLLVGLCSADSWPCEFTDSEGNHYDFTPQRDTLFNGTDSGNNKYFFYLCDSISKAPNKILHECAHPTSTQVCQHSSNDYYISCGRSPLTKQYQDTKVEMSSWAGDTIFCPGGSIYSVRQTVLNVHCSKNSHYQEGTVLISTPDRRNPCSYVIDVYTSVGCPTKKPVPVYDCVFKDTFNGWVYDLSSENANKHSPDGQYITPDYTDVSFRLCNPTNYYKGQVCSVGTEFCRGNGVNEGTGSLRKANYYFQGCSPSDCPAPGQGFYLESSGDPSWLYDDTFGWQQMYTNHYLQIRCANSTHPDGSFSNNYAYTALFLDTACGTKM